MSAAPFRARWAALVAAAGGALGALAFPQVGWWPLAFVSVAALSLAVHGRRARTGGWLGYLYGAAFFVPLLHWTGVYVGAFPWLLLAAAEAGFMAALGAALTALHRLRAPAFWVACAWVLQEALRDRLPFGGFPWGRLAFSQSDSPFGWFARLGGAPLVTFAVALTGAGCWLVEERMRTDGGFRRRAIAAFAVAALTPGLALLLSGSKFFWTGDSDPSGFRVAVIQGSVPDRGLAFEDRAREVLDNHIAQTDKLAADITAGRIEAPNLVIWPENASDVDPFQDPVAYQDIDNAVKRVGVPVLVGAILQGPGNKRRNAGILWSPTSGPGAQYIKRHPVPFGEYIPLRGVAKVFSSDVNLVSQDMVGGHGNGLLRGGPVPIGDVICFEVAYDSLVQSSVRAGAQLLVVQTNNATFGHTSETYQQLAMTKLRAIETGRTVIQAATTGKSAIVEPDGTIVAESGALFTPDILVASIPLKTGETLAVRVGAVPEYVLALIALAGILYAGRSRMVGIRRRLSRTEPVRPEGGDGDDVSDPSFAQRVLVIVPTYNEIENLEAITSRILAAVPGADVLVVDDGSPDGTGALADKLAADEPRLSVLHRITKEGLGAAYIAGFDWGLDQGYDVLVEMDADGSHAPEQLPRLLAALGRADLVLGSRWIPGGSVVNWPMRRELLSRGGNLYTRMALGVDLRDATGGFRAFRREVLEGIDYSAVASQGYCFQVDLAWRAVRAGFRVAEVPITFAERERGESKMSGSIVREALWRVTQWGAAHRGQQMRTAWERRRTT